MDAENGVAKKPRYVRCENINEKGAHCLRKVIENSKFCIQHTPSPNFNKECPVCLDEENEMYILSCQHRAHIKCLEGMNKKECPLCRAIITNLPISVKKKIKENYENYQREKEEEDREEILNMLRGRDQIRLPPQIELLIALRYLCENGIPAQQIPQDINLYIDPESPLPSVGSIYDTTISRILDYIQSTIEEDDTPQETQLEENVPEEYNEDEPFYFEGGDVLHRIRTVPALHTSISASREVMALFNTMIFTISDLPPLDELFDM